VRYSWSPFARVALQVTSPYRRFRSGRSTSGTGTCVTIDVRSSSSYEDLDDAYHVRMTEVPGGALSPTPHYYEIRGRAAEIARALGSPVGDAEHQFLGMLHDGGWPVNVIAHLVDPARAEAGGSAFSPVPGTRLPPHQVFPSARVTCGCWAPRSPLKWAILMWASSTPCWQ
jgi:hypothetical protein